MDTITVTRNLADGAYAVQTSYPPTAAFVLAQRGRNALAQAAYPQSAEILRRAREAEVTTHRRYLAFAKQATADGHPGIAYLFTAFAMAELIHGQHFERVLTGLAGEVAPLEQRPIAVGSTKENLITAATDELASVNTFYPDILKDLASEGLQDAIRLATCAWNTEKLHLDILLSIQRWTPTHFEAVAKRIEDETGQYFVCWIWARRWSNCRKNTARSANFRRATFTGPSRRVSSADSGSHC